MSIEFIHILAEFDGVSEPLSLALSTCLTRGTCLNELSAQVGNVLQFDVEFCIDCIEGEMMTRLNRFLSIKRSFFDIFYIKFSIYNQFSIRKLNCCACKLLSSLNFLSQNASQLSLDALCCIHSSLALVHVILSNSNSYTHLGERASVNIYL